jgi:hypothetical protein
LGMAAGSGAAAGAAFRLEARSGGAASLTRSTGGSTAVVFGAASLSTGESVCATTRPLLRTPRPLIKLSPCISRGQR